MSFIKKADLNWSSLGFDYVKTDKRFVSKWKDGKWDEGALVEDPFLNIHEGSTALHYGQQCFEGLKAFETKDGKVLLFRPDMNSKRMAKSCKALLMPEYPEDRFIEACKMVVDANRRFVPPYGSGASLYLRPFVIGVGANVGVKPAKEYIFSVFATPVGAYFKGGLQPVNFCIADYDRAAPKGTGGSKVGGNYAASLLAHKEAVDAGFADAIYLDPATRQYIEEVGAANFFGITKDGKFVTPKSDSILPSITKYSLMHIAEHIFNMKVEERHVHIDSIDEFLEAGACGTAAVISPIGGIYYKGKMHNFYGDGKEVGPVTKKLYNMLISIQNGDEKAPEGWLVEA